MTDKLWAVPQFFQPAAVMLNQRVLKEEGVDACQIDTSKPDQLLAAAKKLYAEDGGKPTGSASTRWPPGRLRCGCSATVAGWPTTTGKPALDDPNNAKALAYLKQLTDAQGGFAKVKSFSDAFDFFGKGNQFVKDQVAAQVDAQWYVNVLSPYADQIELGATPFKDQRGQPFAVTGGSSFVIPAKAKNPDAACAWMYNLVTDDAWMAAAQARAATLKESGGMNTGLFTGSPSADQAIKAKYVKDSGNAGFDQTIQTFYDVVANGKSLGASPAGPDHPERAEQRRVVDAAGPEDARAGARRRPGRGDASLRQGRRLRTVRGSARRGRSTLAALGGDTLDEVALTEREHHQHRQGDQQRRDHHVLVVALPAGGRAVLGHRVRDAQRHGEAVDRPALR